MWLFLSLPLIVSFDNVDTSDLPSCGQEVVRSDETLKPSAAADKKKSHRKYTVSAAAELLRGVEDSASAFGQLRRLARSLCFILDNCEVWHPSRGTSFSRCLQSF